MTREYSIGHVDLACQKKYKAFGLTQQDNRVRNYAYELVKKWIVI